MTVVVADTSPLNYLVLIEAIDLLPRLYGTIIIPAEVLDELIDNCGRRLLPGSLIFRLRFPGWLRPTFGFRQFSWINLSRRMPPENASGQTNYQWSTSGGCAASARPRLVR